MSSGKSLPLGPGVPQQRTVGEHPLGLYVLFFTEMWERFSYYGMRALLIYYMTKHLFTPEWQDRVLGHRAIMGGLARIFGEMSVQQQSSQIYGLYTAFVYLTPLVGGMIADRYIGQRKSVFVGGIIMAAAEFTLMSESLFYVGLVMLIIGNGFFKPNISTQVGSLYPKGDDRRDRAFMIFYVGINLGAFFSPLVCGTLGETVGWAYGFGSAGVGMVLGLGLYLWGQRILAPDNVMKRKAELVPVEVKAEEGGAYRGGKVTTLAPAPKAKFTKEEWSRIVALLVLCALNIVFWAVYEQQGNTLALWADGDTDRHFLSWEIPASWFQSVNPAMIFLFTPFINALWKRQNEKGKEPSSVAKMAIGCFLLAISFLVMIGGARAYESGVKASMWWLVGCTGLLTIGELYLSPIGLSLVTKVSPARIVSMMMGMWFISSFFGNYFSGYLGTYWEKMSKTSFFLMLAGLSFGTGVAMLALMKPLKKAIGDENAKHEPNLPADVEPSETGDQHVPHSDAPGDAAQ
jgi:POT family proton-dependent oligopeptide transporter